MCGDCAYPTSNSAFPEWEENPGILAPSPPKEHKPLDSHPTLLLPATLPSQRTQVSMSWVLTRTPGFPCPQG